MAAKKFTAAVIGLGNIGLEYDYDIHDDSRILTHSSGFAQHHGFDLLGGVDPNPIARGRFEKKFKKPAFATLQELVKQGTPKGTPKGIPEVFSLGVPTRFHAEMFQHLLNLNPKAILCEKPLAESFADAQKMVADAQSQKCLLMVNYIRRFLPATGDLKRRFEAGEFGEMHKGVLWYSKGILNNGSHFIDLFRHFFGEPGEIKILRRGRHLGETDAEPDVLIRFGKTDIYCLAGREECFSVKDFELIGSGGKITYENGGETILIKKTRPHPVFPGYTILESAGETIDGDLFRYQKYVTDALYKSLVSGVTFFSDGHSALTTLKIVQNILDSRKEEHND